MNRKGPNNTLGRRRRWDVGSPVGDRLARTAATTPSTRSSGTMDDFTRLRRARPRARAWRSRWTSRCSARPTTRGSSAHPEWFTTKPDGTIAYAENPPKKYQDIYPLNFDNDPEGLYAECLRVVRLWIDAGVTIFRVDNPHTKPLNFWQWLIGEVRKTDPTCCSSPRRSPGRR